MHGFRTRSTWYYAKYLPLFFSSGCTTPISNAGIRMKLLKTKTTLLRWLDSSIDKLVWIMTCSKSAYTISNWHIEICYTYSLTQDAKRLKHEADTETNLEIKCHKYLQVRHFILLCLVRSIIQVLIEPLYCTGYHALQHKCKSNRVAGRQDKRLQHVRPDPAPHQIRHEAHQLEECKKGYRPEVRLISTEPELKICRLQVGGDVSAGAVVAQSAAVQDEKARAQGLPAHNSRCVGQVRRGRGEETFRNPRNRSLRKDGFTFNFFIRATSSSKQVKSVQHRALLEVKALIVQRYSRSKDKKSRRYLYNKFFTVQRLYKQWWTEVARRSDPTHRASYLPFNPKGFSLFKYDNDISHVPLFQNVMQNQYNFCSYLSQCHELWEQADLYVSRGQCEGLFLCFVCFKINIIVFSRLLYPIGPRVRAVDSALQPEGPGLLHQERSQDPECFA